jgi:hypothetical protein
MKHLTTLFAVLCGALILILFLNSGQKTTLQSGNEAFVIVEYSTLTDEILVYHGGTLTDKTVAKGRKTDGKNYVVDILNDLNSKGYSLVSSTSHNFRYMEGSINYVEYNYIFKK